MTPTDSRLKAEAETLRRERDEARAYAERLYSECSGTARAVACVWCGHVYPDGTPASQDERLRQHIEECPDHPVGALKVENERLRTALRAAADDLEQWGKGADECWRLKWDVDVRHYRDLAGPKLP